MYMVREKVIQYFFILYFLPSTVVRNRASNHRLRSDLFALHFHIFKCHLLRRRLLFLLLIHII